MNIKPPDRTDYKKFYLTTTNKLWICLAVATTWLVSCYNIAIPWIEDLTTVTTPLIAYVLVFGIALIPGFFNAFLAMSMLFDRRPKYECIPQEVLPISILIAAYNEQDSIIDTLESIKKQEYGNVIEVIVTDDGSTDNTAALVDKFIQQQEIDDNKIFKLITGYKNQGKSVALNRALKECTHDTIITIDADSYLFKDALTNIVTNYTNSPLDTAAIAGTVLVRNSRVNWLTKLQEWEYFISLSMVKRSQSLFQGTLVAQGAFSLYKKAVVERLKGWATVVGEDIVLTWGIRSLGYNVGHAENAIIFTNVPEKYKVFFNQRRRWARGLIEAFKQYPSVIWTIKRNTVFIWLNLLFPFLDTVFLFGFVPGIVLALVFEWYYIVSLLTLLLLPMALLLNYLTYRKHVKTFEDMNLRVRKNILGFMMFMCGNQFIITPACLMGYLDEFLKLRKTWGTKEVEIHTASRQLNKYYFFKTAISLITISIIILGTILFPLVAFSDEKLETHYDYAYDNSGFYAHQIQNIYKTQHNINLTHNYYDAVDNNNRYSYNHATATTSIIDKEWSIVVGPGIISSSQGNTNPSYTFIGNYQLGTDTNVELSADRTPLMAGNFGGDNSNSQIRRLADYVSDNITLSGEHQLTSQWSVAGSLTNQEISDGNQKQSIYGMVHYQVNDNWGIQYRERVTFSDMEMPSYFSPKEFHRSWLLLSYARPVMEDRIALKIKVGPGIVKVNDRTEGAWLLESSVSGKLTKDIKLESHVNCSSSVYDYEFCVVGTQINFKF